MAKLASLAGILALLFLLLFDGREVVLRNVDPVLKQRIAQSLGLDQIEFSSIGFSLGSGDQPAGLTLNDVTLDRADGTPNVHIPRIETEFSLADSMQGLVRPKSLEVSGAGFTLERDARRRFSLSASDDPNEVLSLYGSGTGRGFDLSAVLGSLQQVQDAAILEELAEISLSDVSFTYRDQTVGEVWTTKAASVTARRTDIATTITLSADITSSVDQGSLAIRASLVQDTLTLGSRLALQFDAASPASIGRLIEPLSWLSVLDVPVDGTLAVELSAAGDVTALYGQLKGQDGHLVPAPGREIPFESAGMYFSYDPGAETFVIDALSIRSETLALESHGVLLPQRAAAGPINGLEAQVYVDEAVLNYPDLLSGAVTLDQASAALRVSFDPFRMQIASLEVKDGLARASISGDIKPDKDGWRLALDASATDLDLATVLTYWPESHRPGLRKWLSKNIVDGVLTRASAALRRSGAQREVAFDFDFDDAVARPLRGMPSIVLGRGSGQMIDGRFDLVLDRGWTGRGAGQGVNLAGSRMVVADTRRRPSIAQFDLVGQGAIPNLLKLIDNPPLRLLQRAGRAPDLAEGTATVAATVQLPLKEGLRGADVAVSATAELQNVRSDTLIAGRSLTAEELALSADRAFLGIEGRAALDGVEMDMAYGAPLGQGEPAKVRGQVVVTPDALPRLGIPIPAGLYDGTSVATFEVDLAKGSAPRYAADLALRGARLSIPAFGWSKPAASGGRLRIEGALADVPSVERIALDAPGLALEGALDLNAGGLAGAEFDAVKLGRWIDAPMSWRRVSGGADQVAITGGTLDLRGRNALAGGGGPGLEIAFSPDAVFVSDTIRLTGVQGQMTLGGRGTRGRFTARVNGGVGIDGVLQPNGQVYVSSADSGAALRDAGIFRNATGGTLRVFFRPDGKGGGVDGGFSIQGTRVQDAPVLAEILTIASVVGLVDRLAGPGIGFDDIQGRFRIENNQITIRDARGVGPSLGVTLEGRYDTAARRLRLQGVVSPLYIVNGLLQRVPILGRVIGGRPGEGLLGANFAVTGTAAQPEVSVNPLSALAPGATREFFQSAVASQ